MGLVNKMAVDTFIETVWLSSVARPPIIFNCLDGLSIFY